MIKRKQTKQITIGNVKIGGNAPISVQSMTNTDTRDIKSTINQINDLYEAGCELIRLAILNEEAAEAIKEIKKRKQEIFYCIYCFRVNKGVYWNVKMSNVGVKIRV